MSEQVKEWCDRTRNAIAYMEQDSTLAEKSIRERQVNALRQGKLSEAGTISDGCSIAAPISKVTIYDNGMIAVSVSQAEMEALKHTLNL